MSRPRVLVVGGGFGGLATVRRLRNTPVEVVLVDARNHHLFQPLLYQVATAVLSPGEIAPPLRGVLRHQRNVQVVLGEVTGADLAGRRVTVRTADGASRQLGYDFLVAAPGARSSYFGHDDWARHLYPMKSLEEALALRSRLLEAYEIAHEEPDGPTRDAWLTFAIVGGGPTGVELAGELMTMARELVTEFHTRPPLRPRVVLADAGGDVLAPFAATLRGAARRRLAELGVELRLNRMVTGVDEGGVDLRVTGRGRPHSDGGVAGHGTTERVPARTVVWAAGVAAAPLAGALGEASGAPVDRNGRVLVGPDCSLPGHPEAFVIGDAANQHDLPGVCEPAMQEGWYVARRIRRQVAGQPAPGPFRYHDLGTMATVGPKNAVAELGPVHLSGVPGKLVWAGVHIAFLVGWGNRAGVLGRWGWDLATRRQGERVLLDATDRTR